MSILIITRSDDNESVSMVERAIEEKGGESFRFDTDRFPTEIRLAARYDKGSERLMLESETRALDLINVSAIWHRRLNVGGRIPETLDAQMRGACVAESRAVALGMIASLYAFRMDAVHNIRRAENKQLQLQAARALGLEIPRTLITNDPESVREFASSCTRGLVAKMLSSFAIYEDGQEKVVFTNPVEADQLDHLDGLRLCPMTFQERIPKLLELRATVVGDRVFTASIDSQSSERAASDWRRDGVALLDQWKPYDLPADIKERLLRLMDYFSLNYGAIDLILTPNGQHVFLEVNPVGEFFWLERCPGLAISEAIADVLLGRSCRR